MSWVDPMSDEGLRQFVAKVEAEQKRKKPARQRRARGVPAEVQRVLAEAARQAVAWEQDLPPGDRPPDDPDLDLRLSKFPLTDLGNAERFRERNKGRMIYVDVIGWHIWDGRRWNAVDADAAVGRAVHETVRGIQREAKALRESDQDLVVGEEKDGTPVMLSEKVAKWGRASEAGTKMAVIAKHASHYLACPVDRLDSDPWKFNVQNGTLCFRRAPGEDDPVTFRPHDPADMITKLAPVHYDPAATCSTYDVFLEQVQPDPINRAFLHRWAGYSLTGDIGEQKLTFYYGRGKNGKSTFVDAVSAITGDYGDIMPIETFLDQGRGRNAGAATPDLAMLPGVRMLVTSEPGKNSKIDEALIKLVTGGERIQVRHLNKGYFKFRPSFKLTMSGNYRPQVSGTDEGIWRRVVLVPWPVTIENADLQLPAKLAAETSGILNRLLDGLRDYLENGLAAPSDVTEATRVFREDSDPLGQFLADCVQGCKGDRVSSRRMHEVFVAWARASGEREWSPKGLAGALKERGFRALHSNGTFWLDCRLVRSEVDFGSDPPHPLEREDLG